MRRIYGQRPPSHYTLAFEKPQLAKEWHPFRNGLITPHDIPPDSREEVWWVCRRGHEWKASVITRCIIKGCPLCNKLPRASKAYTVLPNSLLKKNPALAREWHKKKNRLLSPGKVTFGSHKKVWWICSNGHEWVTRVKDRSEGSGCPVCARLRFIGRPSTKYEKSLLELNPSLAREWHHEKNGELTPHGVTPGSERKIWWICAKGHEWQAKIYKRNEGRGCPVCAGKIATPERCLLNVHPTLAREWHHEKNGELAPHEVTPGSRRRVWWMCSRGHEWRAHIFDRSSGTGCPGCSHRIATPEYCLSSVNPTLAKEWHPRKNKSLTPFDVTPGSDRKAWWRCSNGHEWSASIYHRQEGKGCPLCAHRKATPEYCLAAINPSLAREWHPGKNGALMPHEVTPGADRKVWWRCSNGHEWEAKVYKRNEGKGCPLCWIESRGKRKTEKLIPLQRF